MSDPNDIPKNYSISNLKEYENKAIESYEKGNIIEAFVMIYTILEMELNIIWNIFVSSIIQTNPRPAPKTKEYSDLVDLLNEFEILNDNQSSILREFKTGRNKVVHNLPSHMKKKPKTKFIDDEFNKGMKALDFVDRAIVTTAKKSFPKSLMPKKT